MRDLFLYLEKVRESCRWIELLLGSEARRCSLFLSVDVSRSEKEFGEIWKQNEIDFSSLKVLEEE